MRVPPCKKTCNEADDHCDAGEGSVRHSFVAGVSLRPLLCIPNNLTILPNTHHNKSDCIINNKNNHNNKKYSFYSKIVVVRTRFLVKNKLDLLS
jgi:hypothetical protein